MHSTKIKQFLSTGVAQTAPVSPYKWRTLPALARGIGGSIEDVLAGLKEDPRAFKVRLGERGDLYVASAD